MVVEDETVKTGPNIIGSASLRKAFMGLGVGGFLELTGRSSYHRDE